ncbi:hypothetical protein V1J52_20925 [Streptomyces sp. TRM 70351]|uniref:hypothetical protein n=1 Tax=Streptomyces sp. TRM 70351 TaxID=3116552 RepID=UPI002E7B07AD|nr:hypothetical protein [Streptomyces sp. TRM 70351]MEE1930622.1 hypothetical protein [Streptomyces sp. TRM 70351]
MELEAVPAAERGATHVTDRVIAKIAAQAAHEALHPAGAPAGTGGGRAQHATVARRTGPGPGGEPGEARLRVSVELPYPSDIGAQCGAVRRRVTGRVQELAGFTVPEVAVDVERLTSPHLARDTGGRVR